MTNEEIKDELYRMLSDVVNGGCPIRNNTQKGRYREAVKEAVEVLEIFDIYADTAYECGKHANKWIPVSERLPEENICEAPGPVWKRKVLITGYHSFNSKEDTFISVAFAKDVKNNSIQDVNVIAWMPYPKIYKESEE